MTGTPGDDVESGDTTGTPEDDDPGPAPDGATRRATLRTTHDDPARVAAALTPDNTDEMATRVEDGRLVTTVERDSTGGLASTIDDYVVNLSVAERTAQAAKRTSADEPNTDQ